MKELSIEEKAKRYDLAIEKAKSKIKNDKDHVLYEDDVIEIFPELKESEDEDERIRKDCIKYLDWEYRHCYLSDKDKIKIKKCIAWLERQGKNNMGISEATKQKLADNLNKALEKETSESWNEFLDEQGEQKPSEDEDREYACQSSEHYTRRELMIYNLGIADGKRMIEDAIKETEQKPAWSEEDKDFMYDTLSNLTELKDRYGEGYGNVGKCIDWLKSLKDRYTWKPSDEQLHYLSWIANIKLGDSVVEQEVSKHLNELLEDLKKLREE